MDCSKTINYFAARKRLCEYFDDCTECPLSNRNNSTGLVCTIFQYESTEKAIAVVQKWSNEHPLKRYKDDFFNKFPNAEKVDDHPNVCRERVYGIKCNHRGLIGCINCWNEPMPEEKEEEK